MRGILLSTTNTIQGADIEKYIDLVFSNVVIGTNVFSDIGASFTDFFGGTSGIYKGKLNKMREFAIAEVKTKASSKGANAIIGLRVDFDEISGKGKSMFMISVSGTAVKIKQREFVKEEYVDDSIISSDELNNELTRRNILLQLENNKLPLEDQWEILLSNPDYEIAVKLFPFYLSHLSYQETERDERLLSNYYSLMKGIDPNLIIEFLYDNLSDSDYNRSTQIVKIIYDNQFFNPNKVKELIEKGRIKEAVLCLSTTKDSYNQGDIVLMRQILNLIDELPDTGKIESVKSGLMAKEKEKFVCENGHKNDVNVKFCQSCGKNIKGLTIQEIKRIEGFRKRVDSIEYLFKKSNIAIGDV